MTKSAAQKEQEGIQLTCKQAGKAGGLSTKFKYGIEHYRRAGRKGQAGFRDRYTQEDRRRFGAMGGRPRKQPYMGENGKSK